MLKRHEARWRSGAARSRSRPDVPLVPAGISGTERLARLGPLPVAMGHRSRRTTSRSCLSPRPRASRPSGCATRSRRWSRASYEAASHRRRRLVHPSRVPRAAQVDEARGRRSGQRVDRVHGHAHTPVAGRAAADGARGLGHARRPDVPSSGAGRVSEREGLRGGAPRAARPPARRRRFDGVCDAKAAGYEADDFLAAAAAQEEAAGGAALVATSDRDAFQLVTDRVTVLQPAKGGPARIGPAEVRERYGVDPAQVPDFIALRGDPSDRIPGARGIGQKRGAELLAQYRLDSTRCSGRVASRRRRTRSASTGASPRWIATRPYRRSPTSRPTGPLRPSTRRRSSVSPRTPVRGGAHLDVISHPSFTWLHVPETSGNPEHPGRLQCLLDRFRDYTTAEPASRAQLELVTRRCVRRRHRGDRGRGVARSRHVRAIRSLSAK